MIAQIREDQRKLQVEMRETMLALKNTSNSLAIQSGIPVRNEDAEIHDEEAKEIEGF